MTERTSNLTVNDIQQLMSRMVQEQIGGPMVTRPPISYRQLDEVLEQSSRLADENQRLREALEQLSMRQQGRDPLTPAYVRVDRNGPSASGSGMSLGVTSSTPTVTETNPEISLTQQAVEAGLMDWNLVELCFIPRKLRASLHWLATRFNQMSRVYGMNQERVMEYKNLTIETVELAMRVMIHYSAHRDQIEIMTSIRMEFARLPDFDPSSPYPYPTLEIDVENLIPFPGSPERLCVNPTSIPRVITPTLDDEEALTMIEGWTFIEAPP